MCLETYHLSPVAEARLKAEVERTGKSQSAVMLELIEHGSGIAFDESGKLTEFPRPPGLEAILSTALSAGSVYTRHSAYSEGLIMNLLPPVPNETNEGYSAPPEPEPLCDFPCGKAARREWRRRRSTLTETNPPQSVRPPIPSRSDRLRAYLA